MCVREGRRQIVFYQPSLLFFVARILYYGLIAILIASMAFSLIIFEYGVSVMGDSVKAISELASIYDLDHVSCALYSGYCNID